MLPDTVPGYQVKKTIFHQQLADIANQFLQSKGYVVINNIENSDEAKTLLRYFGDFIPQYDSSIEYEVKAKPGFERFQYTKSTNYISPHTEAPDYPIPPKYLALYCVQQAKCGGGQTQICDITRLFTSLNDNERDYLLTVKHQFIGGNVQPDNEKTTLYEGTCWDAENAIFRFSYNYFTYNNVHGFVDDIPDNAKHHSDPDKIKIAQSLLHYFNQHAVSILIPNNALLVWNNHLHLHARSFYTDKNRHLIRFWLK